MTEARAARRRAGGCRCRRFCATTPSSGATGALTRSRSSATRSRCWRCRSSPSWSSTRRGADGLSHGRRLAPVPALLAPRRRVGRPARQRRRTMIATDIGRAAVLAERPARLRGRRADAAAAVRRDAWSPARSASSSASPTRRCSSRSSSASDISRRIRCSTAAGRSRTSPARASPASSSRHSPLRSRSSSTRSRSSARRRSSRRISPQEVPTDPEGGSVFTGLRYIRGSAVDPAPRCSPRRRSTSSTSSSSRSSSSTRHRTLGVSAGTLGLVLGAGAVGGLVGSVVTAPLARRIGVGPAFVVGCVLSRAAAARPARRRLGCRRALPALPGRVRLRLRRDDPRHQRGLDLRRGDPAPAALSRVGRVHVRELRGAGGRLARGRSARELDRTAPDALDRHRRRLWQACSGCSLARYRGCASCPSRTRRAPRLAPWRRNGQPGRAPSARSPTRTSGDGPGTRRTRCAGSSVTGR